MWLQTSNTLQGIARTAEDHKIPMGTWHLTWNPLDKKMEDFWNIVQNLNLR